MKTVLSRDLFHELQKVMDLPDDIVRLSIHLAANDIVRVTYERVQHIDKEEFARVLSSHRLVEEGDHKHDRRFN